MKEITFSIIIPCYNGWKYIGKCLVSLENQTYKPNQVIVVDDCSTDDSYIMLQNYARTSSLNIEVVQNTQNSGPSISRKNALKMVTSAYVCFCDCDDWYELNFLEKLSTVICNTDADLIVFDNYKVIGEKKEKANITVGLQNLTKKEMLALYPMSLCRFCVLNDIAQEVYFPPLYNGEDAAVASQIIEKTDNTVVLNEAYYNYLYRESSASMKPSSTAYIGMINAFNVINTHIDTGFETEIEFIGIKMVCYGATLNAFKADIDIEKIKSFYKDFLENYPLWHNNKYINKLGTIKKMYLWMLKHDLYVGCRMLSKMHTTILRLR